MKNQLRLSFAIAALLAALWPVSSNALAPIHCTAGSSECGNVTWSFEGRYYWTYSCGGEANTYSITCAQAARLCDTINCG